MTLPICTQLNSCILKPKQFAVNLTSFWSEHKRSRSITVFVDLTLSGIWTEALSICFSVEQGQIWFNVWQGRMDLKSMQSLFCFINSSDFTPSEVVLQGLETSIYIYLLRIYENEIFCWCLFVYGRSVLKVQ